MLGRERMMQSDAAGRTFTSVPLRHCTTGNEASRARTASLNQAGEDIQGAYQQANVQLDQARPVNTMTRSCC